MSPSDTLRSIGRTAVGAAALFVLYPMAFAAGFISTLAGPAWRASAPDPLQRVGRDLSAYLAARRREREALGRAKARAERKAAKAAKRAAREERKAAKAAKRAAREERKRLRRAAAPATFEPWNSRENAKTAARQVRAARAELRRIRALYDAERTCAWLADIEADPYRRREAVQRIGEERLKSFVAEYSEKRAVALAAAPPGLHAATHEAAIAMVGLARAEAREAELRYAIACAAAGAVPGGRVH